LLDCTLLALKISRRTLEVPHGVPKRKVGISGSTKFIADDHSHRQLY
jgi:hypothetical protein